MSDLIQRLQHVRARIDELSRIVGTSVRLIAVSKTKPIDDIIELYSAGQRYFGENYVDELETKSNDSRITSSCPDIRWQFIGHLQSNKVNRLLTRVPNLDCIQTIDSIELANRLNTNLLQQSKTLNILLQINTSHEQQKSGLDPAQCLTAYEHIRVHCPQLTCQGLMTIGSLDNVRIGDDRDFQALLKCRKDLCEKLQCSINDIELSMGMSNDYECAIEHGSTIVRIGSSLFGNRS
jgi:PLP dependent protein